MTDTTMSRRAFGLGMLAGLATLAVRPASVLAQPARPPQPAAPPPPPQPAVPQQPAPESPNQPIPVDAAGDHVTRLHLKLADANDDGQVTPHELQNYRSTLRNPANFTGYSLGDPSQMRESVSRFGQPYHSDRARTWKTLTQPSTLGRLAFSTLLEVVMTEPKNKYPGFTNWVASLGEAYYYSSPYSLSPLQLVLLSTPLLALEHWIGGSLGRGVYERLRDRVVLGSRISKPEAQVARVVVSNVARESVHYGLNRVIGLVPPQRGRFIIL